MRRRPILRLSLAVLALVVVTLVMAGGERVEARDGEPGDYCSQSPERPFGWRFTPACAEHDACIDGLAAPALEERLRRDDEFHDLLLDARHPVAEGTCGEHLICRAVAEVYAAFVRYLSQRASGGRPP